MLKKRLIAYHLPQFHRIKENDMWWGAGYTEWTALKKWKPYFKGHKLRFPGNLGYYDLLDPSILERQYRLANEHSIEGFCFWTYWFGNGEKLLEKPLDLLLRPQSHVKYCLAWANHDWVDKSKGILLKRQTYLGKKDYKAFFYSYLPHFSNPNYIKIKNRPLISIFKPQDIPDFDAFYLTWEELIQREGFDGMYFISDQFIPHFKYNNFFQGFAHSPSMFKNRTFFQKILEKLIRDYKFTVFGPMKYSFPAMMRNIYKDFSSNNKFIPTIFSGWDTTPRHGKRGVVLNDFDLASFQKHVEEVFAFNPSQELIFIKSWNEWAEGNLLEPDNIFGNQMLEILKNKNQN
ncbi:MAG: glycoside hydrolase family 99-like domain-containing protein [Bdellovibrionales bacterium]|nr:glycoside hydrolase family 99-like domain-containing protein [Bdellovibrionales bacterium]